MRISIALSLFVEGAGHSPQAVMSAFASHPGPAVGLVLLAGMLCLGIVTPVAALLCVILQTLALFAVGFPDSAALILAIANAASLVILGPGAYSVDARLFGPRVIITTSEHTRYRL